jgi:heme/copper-type cytochrome/quinol oxidase subunit 2
MFGIGIQELVIIFILFVMIAAIVIGVIVLIRRSAESSDKKPRAVFCTQCGTQNEADDSHCTRCGTALLPSLASTGAEAPNYLAQAILATIFCCVPLGIPAIVFSAQVNSKLAAGDYIGAVESSKKAKLWCWIAFGAGIVFVIIYFAFVIITTISGIMH